MNTIILSVQYILYILVFVVIAFIYVPYVFKTLARKEKQNGSTQSSRKFKFRRIEDDIEEFIVSSTPGKIFVDLISKGVFLSLKKGNHGNDFPNEKQCMSFMKYSTSDINEIIFDLEVSHEQLNI